MMGWVKTRVCIAAFCSGLVVVGPALAQADPQSPNPSDIGTAWARSAEFVFDLGVLGDLGVTVHSGLHQTTLQSPQLTLKARRTGQMQFLAYGQKFAGLYGGSLAFEGALGLSWDGGSLTLNDFRLVPGSKPVTLHLLNADGVPVFLIDHIHYDFDPATRRLAMFNTDLRISEQLASEIGHPSIAGMAVGTLTLELEFAMPPGADPKDNRGSCANPRWNLDKDVALTNLFATQVGNVSNNQVAIAPMATLQNVGDGEVPWRRAFDPPAPPYNNDQHPILVWALYAISDGIPRMLGQSAAKHAFSTINTDCSCQSGAILWAASHPDNSSGTGCSDTYGASTSDNATWLGPREEIHAFSGVWDHCGSHFDANPADCNRDHPPPNDLNDHRMWIDQSELSIPGADYFYEAWYLVREDSNIFNTMGRIRVNPTNAGGAWSFPILTALASGPAIDEFVSPGNHGDAQSVRITTSEGHLTLAVQTTDLGGGQWRYVYALMNHDFDPKIQSFVLPVADGVSISNLQFYDIDADSGNDWISSQANNQLLWESPAGNELAWGTLFSFAFEADQAPTQGSVNLLAPNAVGNPQIQVSMLGFNLPIIFDDGLESSPPPSPAN